MIGYDNGCASLKSEGEGLSAPSVNEDSAITSFSHRAEVSQEIKALTYYSKWGEGGVGTGATVYYSFPSPGSTSTLGEGYPSESNDPNAVRMDVDYPSDVQMNAAKLALQQWANVANLNFIEVPVESPSQVGDIRFANFTVLEAPDDFSVPYAFAYPPMTTISPGVSGDVWINKETPYNQASEYAVGAKGYYVMLHEIGHAIGLAHPFEEGHETANHKVVLDAAKDHFQYTLMSYSDTLWSGYTVEPTYYPAAPMLLDIQAVQYLYGANTNYQTGDDVYRFGNDYAYEAIWDAGGVDTLENNSFWNSIINLNAGSFSSIGPSVKAHKSIGEQYQNNIAIAYGVTIENAKGGGGNDVIYGNAVSNVVDGGFGADTFVTAQYRSDITSIIRKESGEILLVSADQQDTLINIEKVDFADTEYYLEALLAEATQGPEFSYEVNNIKTVLNADVYTGPVSFLQFEHLGTEKNEIIIAADTNDFVNLLGGDDAAQGGGGSDVLDGGAGSNFLSGGSGQDVFFIDGRNQASTWSTITDFDQDTVNIWGWQAGVSQIMLMQKDGAEGYEGITLHMDLDGDTSIDTSVTFTGLEAEHIANQEAMLVGTEGLLTIT